MNKQDDFVWYDKSVYNAIIALDDKHSNAIEIFGGALGAYEYVNCDEPDFERFVKSLFSIIDDVKFFGWHEGVAGALRTFCRLCYIDPALIECYTGAYFEEFER